MNRTYSNCFYCGGEVEEQYMPRELRWQEKWYILEDVPVGVCQQCGEKFLKPLTHIQKRRLCGILCLPTLATEGWIPPW